MTTVSITDDDRSASRQRRAMTSQVPPVPQSSPAPARVTATRDRNDTNVPSLLP
jgi:hypothetical protein